MNAMKRLVSLVLIVSILIVGIPEITIAETAHSYVKQLAKISYIDDLCAMGNDEPGWHAGMGLQNASSKQIEEALGHLLQEVIAPNLSYLETTVAAQVALGIENEDRSKELRRKRDEYRALRDEVQAYYEIIQSERRYISEYTEQIDAGAYPQTRDAENAAYRVVVGIDKLKSAIKMVRESYGAVGSSDPDTWLIKAYELDDLMSNVDGSQIGEVKVSPLKAHVIRVNTETSERFLKRNMEIAREEAEHAAKTNGDSKDIDIFVVTKYEVLFDLKNENGEPISNAVVKVRDNEGTYTGTVAYNTDAKGYLLSVRDFKHDADINIDIGYEITIPGYQRIISENNITKGGMIFRLDAVPTEKKPYIAGVSFNGEDMYFSTFEIYSTPANDADQNITVHVDMPGGGSSSGSIVMHYIDTDGKEQSVSKDYSVYNGTGKVQFIDKWCRMIQPGQNAVSFTFSKADADDVNTTLLTALKPFENSSVKMLQPTAELNNNTVMSQLLPSGEPFAYTFGNEIPFLKGQKLSLSLPVNLPLRVVHSMDGSWMALLSVGQDVDDFLGNNLLTDKWRTTAQKKIDRNLSKAGENAKKSTKLLREGYLDDHPDAAKSWLGTITAWWSLGVFVNVKPNKTNKDYYNGNIDFVGMAGIQGELSAPCPGFPLAKIKFGAKGGLGLMVQDEFQMKGIFEQSIYDHPHVYILYTISFYASLGIGKDFGSFFNVGFGVKATTSLNVAIPVTVNTASEFLRQLSVMFDVRLLFYVQLFVVHLDVLIARGYFNYQNGSDGGGFKGYIIGIGDLPKSSASPENVSDGDKKDGSIDVSSHTVWDAVRMDNVSSNGPGLQVMPTAKSMEKWYGVDGYVDMIYFVRDNKVYASSDGMKTSHEVQIPDADLAARFASGYYTISNVSINGSNNAEYIRVDGNQLIVHIAAISIGYIKDTVRENVEAVIGEGGDIVTPAKTVDVAKTSGMMTMLVYMPDGATEPQLLYKKDGTPAVYTFEDVDGAIEDISAYPEGIALCNVSGQLRLDTDNSKMLYLYVSTRRGANKATPVVYDYVLKLSDYSCKRSAEEDVLNIKTIRSGDIPMYAGMYDDDPEKLLCFGCGAYDEMKIVDDLGEIKDYVLFADPNNRNQTVILVLTKHEKESEKDQDGNLLKAIVVGLTRDESTGLCYSKQIGGIIDFGVYVNSDNIEIGRLANISNSFDNTIYWYESGSKEKDDKVASRIRGVFFDWVNRRTTTPYTIGTIRGDFSGGSGYTVASTPLQDWVVGGKLVLACPMQLDRDSGKNDVVGQNGPYAVYTLEVIGDTQAEITGLATEYYSMTAGTSSKLSFSIANRGNVPISGMRAKLSRVDKATGKTETLNEWYFNHFNEKLNSKESTSVGTDEVFTEHGVSAIRRVDSVFDRVNEETPYGVTISGTQFHADNGDDPDYARISAMLPEAIFAYSTTFNVPENWSGLQTLRLELTGVYVPLNASAMFGFTGEQNDQLAEGSLLYVDFENKTVSAAMKDGTTLDIDLAQDDIRRTFAVPAPVDLKVDTSEIIADYRLFEKDGEQYITASFSQAGDTAQNASTGNIRFMAYVDNDVYPSFTHTFKNHTAEYVNLVMTVPVSKLTGGRKAETLRLVVVDDSEGIEELTDLNNEHTFHLGNDLRIIRQPKNVRVKPGRNASFGVTVTGGTQPYHYQWKVYYDGKWHDVQGANDAVFTIDRVSKKMNNLQVCCVVTDAAGDTVISDPAKLLVVRVPDTGDHSHVNGYLLTLILSIFILCILMRRRRKGF